MVWSSLCFENQRVALALTCSSTCELRNRRLETHRFRHAMRSPVHWRAASVPGRHLARLFALLQRASGCAAERTLDTNPVASWQRDWGGLMTVRRMHALLSVLRLTLDHPSPPCQLLRRVAAASAGHSAPKPSTRVDALSTSSGVEFHIEFLQQKLAWGANEARHARWQRGVRESGARAVHSHTQPPYAHAHELSPAASALVGGQRKH